MIASFTALRSSCNEGCCMSRVGCCSCHQELTENYELWVEFISSIKELVCMVNAGQARPGMRLKGPTNKSVSLRFSNARNKALHAYSEHALDVDDKYRAIAIEKWQQEHPGLDPRKEHTIQSCNDMLKEKSCIYGGHCTVSLHFLIRSL
eukprot:5392019-Amphidinium_carterae.1